MRAIQPENKEEKQVNNQMTHQDKIITGLGNQVDQLFDALSQVLSETVQKEASDKSQVEVSLCILADSLRDQNLRLQKITDVVVDILARLEV